MKNKYCVTAEYREYDSQGYEMTKHSFAIVYAENADDAANQFLKQSAWILAQRKLYKDTLTLTAFDVASTAVWTKEYMDARKDKVLKNYQINEIEVQIDKAKRTHALELQQLEEKLNKKLLEGK